MIELLVVTILAYLIGSIPFGFLISKHVYGTDIRTVGSKNIGTTNVFRNFGIFAGVIVLAGDLGKGLIAVTVAKQWLGTDLSMILASCAVIVGHNWPITLRLKGGKGIATACGALLILTPMITIVLLLTWTVVVAFTKYVSLGSIAAAALFPILVALTQSGRPGLLIFSVVAAAVVIWRHKGNIQRLLNGSEVKTTLKRKG